MTLPDDETLAEEALEILTPAPDTETQSIPVPNQNLESGMDTGQGADDEPELAIGDRHTADAASVAPEEARRLLGEQSN